MAPRRYHVRLPPSFCRHCGLALASGTGENHAIKEEPRGQYRWTAVDRKTGDVVLRMHDEVLLLNICQSLGWEVQARQSIDRTEAQPGET